MERRYLVRNALHGLLNELSRAACLARIMLGLMAIAGTQYSFAQTLDLPVTFSPSPPVAGRSFTITLPVPAPGGRAYNQVNSVTTTVNGDVITVHGNFTTVPFTGFPEPITQTVPPLAAGRYTLRYVADVQFLFGGPAVFTDYGSLPFTVVAALEGATGVPTLGGMALMALAMALALCGWLGLRPTRQSG